MAQARPKARASKPSAPAPAPRGTQIAFRADDDLIALIDAEAERLKAERPGLTVSRAEVVRDLVYRALRPRVK
jgi:hypothetical protein